MITAFLNHLANADRVSASTQNQALSALLFLYTFSRSSCPGWTAWCAPRRPNACREVSSCRFADECAGDGSWPQAERAALVKRAHQRLCSCSHATRWNVSVDFDVLGAG
jgi:hypothetical protein